MFNFDSPLNLVYGLATGLVFGFLLQRGGVTRFRVIVGQFLLKDHTVLKTMLTAVVVGSMGIWAMHLYGDVSLHVKSVTVVANVAGGLIFGFGMALLGYCPGTGVAALGDGGFRQAAFGILGMIVGAAAYAEVYPAIKANVLPLGSYGKLTFPEMTGLSPWLFVVALAVGAVLLFAALGKGQTQGSDSSIESEKPR